MWAGVRNLCLAVLLALSLTACDTTSDSGTHAPRQVSGRGMAKTKPDPLLTRRIVLVHAPSGEHLDVVYYHDGAYDKDALKKINHIMRDRHANVDGEMDPELIDYMLDLRTRLSLPPTVPFEVFSGYRTRETNDMLARHNNHVAIESLHIHGWAVDFRIAHVNGAALCEIAKTMQRGGVAYYPDDNHVHIDLGNIRTWNGK